MSEKSSRLVVKCLGKHVTEDQLKKLFAKEGTITDLQLKYKKNGNFRHFAFVGFKTVDEAEHAKNTLDNTYFGSSKIVVEFCNSVKKSSEDINEKKVEGITNDKGGKKSKKGAEKKKKTSTFDKDKAINNQAIDNVDSVDEIENDPDFQEFIGAHRNVKTNKSQVWQNDDVQPSIEKKVSKKKENQHNEIQESASKPTKESVKGTFRNTIKLKGIPEEKRNRKDIKTFLDPLKPISLRMPRKVKSIAYAAFRTQEEVEQALLKHRNFMWGTLITVLKYEPKEEEQVDPKYAHQKQLTEDDTKAVLVDTGRIFIRNLCYSCTEEDIEELFKPYGPIAETHLPIDKTTKKIKGFGFVAFLFPEHALKAFNDLDGTIFQGRMLHLIPGEAKPEEKVSLSAKSSFKKRKELEEKKNVGIGHNWNALFLGMNALSEVISEKYDVKKSQLLMEGKPNESIAARVALGETQIVNEIKDFLVSNGVRLDAFDNEKPIRSKTIILVKNLPAKTTQSELEELFSRYGSVSRTILPPSAITAIVEMENSNDAKKVFKKLSYKNFKSNPLYLEWAPMDVFSLDSLPVQSVEGDDKDQASTNSLNDIRKNMASERTILVKNLSDQTSDESFKEHFSECGKVKSVCLMSRKTADGHSKSLGYGFIEFENLKGAEKAMRKLQNSILHGSTLQLKQSKAKAEDPAKIILKKSTNTTEQTSSKIVVRNIPFEATEKDIEQLFSVFGKIKSLRLPKKVTGNHRGFGFVDFLAKEDAKRAFDSLSLSTHLLGRRLVLEWSNDDGDNQDVPKRGRYFDSESNPNKKLKKSELLDDLESSGPVLNMDLE